jgi:N-6 DNA Methylase
MSYFKENLKKMDFGGESSLRFVFDLENSNNLKPFEVFALEKANDFKATAVYFRHFSDGRTPVPQIYIYDNTASNLTDQDLAEIHRDLWSYCLIPMFIVIEKTDVKIYDARQSVKILDANQKQNLFAEEIAKNPIESCPIDNLKISSEAIKLYSRKLFDSGVFWESKKAEGKFLEKTSAYNDLIVNLKKVRKDFIKKTTLPEKTANKLLVFSILIKYLEERGNENESLFAQDFFQKLDAENFCGVLRQKGKIVTLFEELSRHFNGRIFEWTKQENKEIAEADLTQLAYFLDGDSNLETGQLFFDWRKYSFNHLPVELISSVYEELLNERDDAVYTPEFLVNTLIDESMPQKDFKKLSVKTIDVSCGSGIFLVSAFKRLAQRHRYAEFKKTGKLKSLKSKKLLKIIKDNLFGVDIEEDAVRLTVFSLCLALCDELTPKEIWTELQFDDTFETNFKATNFFDYLESDEEKIGTFDLVIGNVPFIELTIKKDKGEVYYYIDKHKKEVNLNVEVSQRLDAKKNVFSRNQLALMFLDQSPRLLTKDGLLCLIMPAAPLLYNNTAEFRKDFFTKHQVFQLLDLTSLAPILYGTANVPTTAIFVNRQEPDEEKPIIHVTVRRTKSVEEKIFFEIDKYDFHYVSPYDSLHNKHIWKCNLLGGGRLKNLIDRLTDISSIEKFKDEREWFVGEGYKIYRGKGKSYSADYITGKTTIPAQAFGVNKVDESKVDIETAELFERPRKKEIYQPPLLIIRKNNRGEKILTYFSDDDLRYNDSLFGISAPNDRRKLKALEHAFDLYKDVYKLFITATSNEFGVGRATSILKQDIMNLPYSEDREEMKLSYVEQIICDDVLDYQIEMLSKGSSAEANWKKASKPDLKKFGEVFSEALNSVYEESGKCYFLKKIYDWGAFYITEFNYGKPTGELGDAKKINELTEHIESLIETKYRPNVLLIKILKLYEKDRVYLIKPKTLRYWLRSIAIKDADEVFSDLIDAGY